MCKFTPANSAPGARPAFVEAFPALSHAHRTFQCAMFAAATEAKLSRSRDLQIRGINEALGLKGDERLTSRREMNLAEMKAVTVAIEAGLFSDDWTWGHDFTISIRPLVIELPAIRVVVKEEIHFEPIAGRYERMAAKCDPAPDWLLKVAGLA